MNIPNVKIMLAALFSGALPMGDNTPIGLYIGIGIIALLLIVAVVIMNIMAKKK